MKKYFDQIIICFLICTIGFIHSCKKEYAPINPLGIRITESYTEEFDNVPELLTSGGWYVPGINASVNPSPARWTQGQSGKSKGDTINWYGFRAYSNKPSDKFTNVPPQDEFAYSYSIAVDSAESISSWLISPILFVKNGDKISFYTRGDTTGIYTDRLQVVMNRTASINVGNELDSMGDFTTILDDINAVQAPGGYPRSWTKKEYTFDGIPGRMDVRIGFRHYVVNPRNARGVGIDLFKFDVK